MGTVKVRSLGFFESLCDDTPAEYLQMGDKVRILSECYGRKFGDKKYLKIEHQYYGIGYVLQEGLDIG